MDEQFKDHMNTVLSERQSSIVVHFQRENSGHYALMEKIKREKESLKASLSTEMLASLERLLEFLSLQIYQEGKLLYTQGTMDCVFVVNRVILRFRRYKQKTLKVLRL